MKKLHINNLADIKTAYPLRGKVNSVADGDLNLIRLNDINVRSEIDWSNTIRINRISNREPDYIKSNSVLFVFRGAKFFSVFTGDVPKHTVASPQFYVLDNFSEEVLPEYLNWFLNSTLAQKYYSSLGNISSLKFLGRKEFGCTEVMLPSIEDQKKIVLANNLQKKQKLLLEEKAKLNELLISNILEKKLLGEI